MTPSYFELLSDYQRAIKSKAKILENEAPNPQEIAPWNEIIAQNGKIIREQRASFAAKLEEQASKILAFFAKKDGEVKIRLENSRGQALEASLETELEKNLSREIAAQLCLIGPHRDRLAISVAGYPAESFSSQGQVRSLTLSLILAAISIIEAEIGETPVVLLDDVNSELDSERSELFFSLLRSSKRQILVSGTDANLAHLMSSKIASKIEAKNGSFQRL
jgi:DNA replication and repair protein RecF